MGIILKDKRKTNGWKLLNAFELKICDREENANLHNEMKIRHFESGDTLRSQDAMDNEWRCSHHQKNRSRTLRDTSTEV